VEKTPTQAELEKALAVVARSLQRPAPAAGEKDGVLVGVSGLFATLVDANGNVVAVGSPLFVDPIDRATRLAGRTSVGVGDSIQAAGKVTAPGLGAAIVTLAAPPAGVYQVEVDVSVSAAGADANNMKMQKQGVDLFNPILVNNLNVSQHMYRVTLNGSQNLSINAVAAGTAAVVYLAQLVATRVE
jgi:hypothetical protein